MTAEIVNLKSIRKRKARAEREAVADANRLKHGRSKHERERQKAQRSLDERRLDAHERDD
jgi:hypothetical protein